MVWSGDFVASNLNLGFTEKEQPVKLEQLVGLALRDNPKRAHLLVSNVLGKHIPVSPDLLISSAEILAVIVDEKLKGTKPIISDLMLTELSKILNKETTFVKLKALLKDYKVTSQSIVLGYAETATALGAIVANKLDSYYINSTRYPSKDIKNYGVFEEEHSHATSHNITPKNVQYLNSDLPLVLVDDELTTGNTVLNTIKALHAKHNHPKYVIASLVDLRDELSHKRMEDFAVENNIIIEVAALSSGVVTLPENSIEVAQSIIRSGEGVADKQISHESKEVTIANPADFFTGSLTKDGVDNFGSYNLAAVNFASRVHPMLKGNHILVLGLEEEMYLPILVSRNLNGFGLDVKFSSTTRSPVFPKASKDYAIQDKIMYTLPHVEDDTPIRYAYNIGNQFDTIVIFSNDEKPYNDIEDLVNQLRRKSKRIIIMKYKNLSEPLVGPAFGSYSSDDVKWLLKDLSDVELEIVTEEREEAIQSGGAHYAESLPIEFQPSIEYQELFKSSLQESSYKLAVAVGVVSEQIVKQRKSPVLVSLARAGTPVGVLIKRYIQDKYRVNLPHYAVSIVRGKGIDANALRYLAANHHPEDIIFVDGWTGKGAIVKELKVALEKYGNETGDWFNSEVAVLADPGNCVKIFGTREDYLIPSACLNSTVSGLISRTVLNENFIGEDDYHGAKFYKEFLENDYSNYFIDEVAKQFPLINKDVKEGLSKVDYSIEPTFEGWASIEKINTEYGINNINLVKPGVGETTRVLLRRVPWKILVRKDQIENLKHIKVLAEERGTVIELVDHLPYSCVGLIHPQYTKGATGFDGVATS